MNDKLEITTIPEDGATKTQTLFMSFGLLNQISGVVGNIDRLPMIDIDPDLAGILVAMALVPRHPSGRTAVDLDKFESPGLSIEEAEKVLDWIKEHVLGFFTRRVQANLNLVDANREVLKDIGSSLGGLKDEASKS